MPHTRIAVSAFMGLFLTSLLTGCTLQTTSTSEPIIMQPGSAVTGTAFGGQQPIAGAKVYLLAANFTGNAGPFSGLNGVIAPSALNASISMLNPAAPGISGTDSIGAYVLTGSTGNFSLSGDYTCATGYQQASGTSTTLTVTVELYVYVLGGDPGYGGTNASIGMLAALGPCSNQFTSHLSVNEVTTIGTAYALAGYATDATHISTDGTAFTAQAIINSFITVQNLVSLSGGSPGSTLNGNAAAPTENIFTLANILAACVNSTGASGSCSTLFSDASSTGTTGTVPTDTATAAINLAHNPYPSAAAVTTLFNLQPPTAPFSGGLTTQPGDFTLAIVFTDGSLNQPFAVAADVNGHIWFASVSGSTVSQFTPLGIRVGAALLGGGIDSPHSLAFDNSDNLWISNGDSINNNGAGSISEYIPSSATFATNSPFISGGFDGPEGMALDGTGDIWVANTVASPTSLSAITSNGTAVTNSPFTGGGLNSPYSTLAIDGAGHIWAGNAGNSTLSEFSHTGTPISPAAAYTGGGLDFPEGIAVDSTGNAWVADRFGNALSEFSQAGTPVSATGYTGGGLNNPFNIAVDGSNRIWISNLTGNVLSVFTDAGVAVSGPAGYYGTNSANFNYTGDAFAGLAIDGSGNVWIGDQNTGGFGENFTEFVGAATPVLTPVVANLPTTLNATGASNLGTRP